MLLAHVVANLCEVALHAVGILVVDDFEQLLQLGAYLAHLVVGVGVEEYFLQQVVVFAEHALGNAHVALEGGAGSVLRFHDGCEDEGGDEGNGERIGDGLVVLEEGVLVDVESQPLVEVAEEDAPDVVALADDDGVLFGELVEVGKRRAEHGVGGDIGMAALLVELLQARLHRGDVADDAVGGQQRQHLLVDGDGVLQRDGVDDQLWSEAGYLVDAGEALAVVGEPHALRVAVVDGHFMVETEQVDEERPHFACTKD